jgi:hypothetical protein
MKTAIILSLLGVVALSANVEINTKAIDALVEDVNEFAELYDDTLKVETRQVARELANAYKNTAGKLILNFGSQIAPAGRETYKMLEYVQVNPTCNQTAAVDCLGLYDGFRPNVECLAAAGCQFKFETPASKRLIAVQGPIAEVAVKNAEKFLQQLVRNETQRLGQAVGQYVQAQQQLTDEFAALVRKHAVDTFGCNAECVDSCLDNDYIAFHEVPQCAEYCPCTGGNLVIAGGEYNYPALMQFNDGNKQAWSFFKKNQNFF